MSRYRISVLISKMTDQDNEPEAHVEAFQADSRHAVVHQTCRWIRERLVAMGVQEVVNPQDIEKVTAGIEFHEWFYNDFMSVKVRARQEKVIDE